MTHRGHRLQHAAVWTAIDDLAVQSGLSCSGMARRCGLDATALNPSKRLDARGNCRWPSMATVTAALEITNTTYAEFGVLVDEVYRTMRQTPHWAIPKLKFVA